MTSTSHVCCPFQLLFECSHCVRYKCTEPRGGPTYDNTHVGTNIPGGAVGTKFLILEFQIDSVILHTNSRRRRRSDDNESPSPKHPLDIGGRYETIQALYQLPGTKTQVEVQHSQTTHNVGSSFSLSQPIPLSRTERSAKDKLTEVPRYGKPLGRDAAPGAPLR